VRSSGLRNRHLLLVDVTAVIIAPLIAFIARFEGTAWLGTYVAAVAAWYIVLSAPTRIAVFYGSGLYSRLWRQASLGELKRILLASFLTTLLIALVGFVLVPQLAPTRVPFSVVFMDAFLTATLVTLPRLWARIQVHDHGLIRRRKDDPGNSKRVLIVGAGDSAKLVCKELCGTPDLGLTPIGFVDDDPAKQGKSLCDLPVLGSLNDIRDLVAQYAIAELIIAMPSVHGRVVRQVVRAALDCGISTLTVPSLSEVLLRRSASTSLREVEIQDLLRRDPVETDLAAVAALATNETVLVTGAGGSIGSELCRQLSRLAPARLVLLGHGENSIFEILEELRSDYEDVQFIPVIADVRDRERIAMVMQHFRPHAVFHAAAHKHVPLMEANVVEAITNNVVGTRNVVDGAVAADVDHLVLISTDKAVRPTSIMGATKRLAEQIVQHAATKYERNYVSVRFGNVLGSRGSVVPTFLRQIRAGGPVTVTHPEMRRYFMTIPEAVQLVLQAGALGRGGEVFVLDMGEPVRVFDLATDLIRLSGLNAGTDIEIKFTGIRPGEKLYEEMFFSGENVLSTDHPKVLRARNGLLTTGVITRIQELARIAESGTPSEELRKMLQVLVPDFHPHGANPRETPAPQKQEAPIASAGHRETLRVVPLAN
jgi:FlaA1/EpsC-like NDP-sugar epimerase